MAGEEDAMELNRQTAEQALDEALKSNPGAWGEHSRYVARACENIALHCKNICRCYDKVWLSPGDDRQVEENSGNKGVV